MELNGGYSPAYDIERATLKYILELSEQML